MVVSSYHEDDDGYRLGQRGPVHGALTVVVEDDHDLGRVMSAGEFGRSVLACILDRLDRPLLDDLTEQLVDRAAAMGAAITHVGRPELAGSRRRKWKRLAGVGKPVVSGGPGQPHPA